MMIRHFVISRGFLHLMVTLLLGLGGCATDEYAFHTAVQSESYQSLARTYLGDEKLAYLISDFNRDTPLSPGKVVAVPLKPVNPGGIYSDGYQTVPILVYHQISPKKTSGAITVSEEIFERQMAYLKQNGYHTLTMKQFMDFIEYRLRPPCKSVLITIDDGWKSAGTIAYPILKKYGFSAVLFLNTDQIRAEQNPLILSWEDVRALKASGLFDIESHTVTHTPLNRLPDNLLQSELRESQRIIYEQTGVMPDVLAYPDGVFDDRVIAMMKQSGYRAGFTVIRGGNPSFNNPFSLNRSMVYNNEKMGTFIKMLETYRRE